MANDLLRKFSQEKFIRGLKKQSRDGDEANELLRIASSILQGYSGVWVKPQCVTTGGQGAGLSSLR